MIAVVYLMRDKEGYKPFLDSYYKHVAGQTHDLFLISKGFEANGAYTFRVPTIGTDLDSYRYAAKIIEDHKYFVFLNSNSIIQADNWLLKLWKAAQGSCVGLVGTSCSCESFYTNNPSWWRKLLFQPFPNFHVRTNGFMIQRDLMLKVWPRWIGIKKMAYLFESGRWSLTQRIWNEGKCVIVLDKEGQTVVHNRPCSYIGMFRHTDQNKLMILDKQSCSYKNANKDQKQILEKAAYGISQ